MPVAGATQSSAAVGDVVLSCVVAPPAALPALPGRAAGGANHTVRFVQTTRNPKWLWPALSFRLVVQQTGPELKVIQCHRFPAAFPASVGFWRYTSCRDRFPAPQIGIPSKSAGRRSTFARRRDSTAGEGKPVEARVNRTGAPPAMRTIAATPVPMISFFRFCGGFDGSIGGPNKSAAGRGLSDVSPSAPARADDIGQCGLVRPCADRALAAVTSGGRGGALISMTFAAVLTGGSMTLTSTGLISPCSAAAALASPSAGGAHSSTSDSTPRLTAPVSSRKYQIHRAHRLRGARPQHQRDLPHVRKQLVVELPIEFIQRRRRRASSSSTSRLQRSASLP